MIKGKRISAKADEADEEEMEDDEDAEDGPSGKPPKKTNSEREGKEEGAGEGKSSKKKKAVVHKTHPDLSNITYLGTGKVKAFTPEISSAIPADMMASYVEGKTYKLAKNPDQVEGWIEHNKVHLR